jgi:hypothetical protein
MPGLTWLSRGREGSTIPGNMTFVRGTDERARASRMPSAVSVTGSPGTSQGTCTCSPVQRWLALADPL